jgi:murein L,D-transpeptidase YcbB/YkuD
MAAIAAIATAGAASCASRSQAGVTAELQQALSAGAAGSAPHLKLCPPRASTACAQRLKDVWTDVRSFYEKRSGEPVWVTGSAPGSAAAIALGAFARAAEHGLDAEAYGATALRTEAARLREAPQTDATATELARFESGLTAGLLALGRDVALGRPGGPPAGVGAERRRKAPDIATRFAAVIDEGDFSAWPDDVRPVHPQYAALQKALGALQAKSNTPSTAPAPPAVPRSEPASPSRNPAGLVQATGQAGGRSGARAVTVTNQTRLLALNLERWRWMPDDFGDRHVIVNVPQYHLYVREAGRTALGSRVIVGKLGDETPLFSADMTHVVLSPYWNIPESIAEGETVPSIVRNPAFLAKNNIEVLRRSDGGVERVDPASVNWNNPAETSELSLRQRPGPGNALGHIKFMFPNRYSVYLHDTPTDNLFDRAGRAFSHGCVRVAEPVALAKYVLADDPKWDEPAIEKAMHSGQEQSVKLKRSLPVHIVYFTAWADDAGNVSFLDDVYGRDR